ncbi:MAG: cupin domain-containing protein [Candidatus Hydrogenedentes bacterium]|nr:cupin domain-containing protein [Candidatus Hydrogenedentota bacterium]
MSKILRSASAHFDRASLESAYWLLGNLHAVLAGPGDTGNAFTVMETIYREGYGPPAHMHTREDELFVVLEGRVRFFAGALEAEHGPGAVAFLPRNLAHTFQPLDGQVRMLIGLYPSGFESYFKAVSIPAHTLGLEPDPVTMPDMEEFIARAADYGLEFLPPGASVAGHPSTELPGLKAAISGAGEGEVLDVIGIPTRVKLSADQTGGVLSAFITEDPKLAGPPLHIHRNEDESVFVLEGDYRIQVGDTLRDASPGDFAYFPRGVAHTYARVGEAPGRLLILTNPGGCEAFFREVDALGADGAPDIAAVEAAAAKHGVEFVGPPIGG